MVVRGILNTTTTTLHKQEMSRSSFGTACGATKFVPDDRLAVTSVEGSMRDAKVQLCGRCFEGGGGY